jgi:hypothetical protein
LTSTSEKFGIAGGTPEQLEEGLNVWPAA